MKDREPSSTKTAPSASLCSIMTISKSIFLIGHPMLYMYQGISRIALGHGTVGVGIRTLDL